MRVKGRNFENKLILKISKSEFELIKVLLYFSKPQNFYGIILLQKRSSQSEYTDCLIKMFSTNLNCTQIALGATMQMPITTYKRRSIFRTQSNICDETFFVKIGKGFQLLTVFTKNPLQMFEWVLYMLLELVACNLKFYVMLLKLKKIVF